MQQMQTKTNRRQNRCMERRLTRLTGDGDKMRRYMAVLANYVEIRKDVGYKCVCVYIYINIYTHRYKSRGRSSVFNRRERLTLVYDLADGFQDHAVLFERLRYMS